MQTTFQNIKIWLAEEFEVMEIRGVISKKHFLRKNGYHTSADGDKCRMCFNYWIKKLD